ncbi:DUF982 domain-containing protein [Shinella sp. 838]|jgi:hypothetical protein|uniref:DUF982 domain-containing protein n=1 Tax=unclassified Shinella TaxID=2643062 RepID=UPI0003C5616E|nr:MULTISPECIES: DUF982 domain-containing protein [unclassified Shinella]EYR82815.1 hypothetical protein SHLA_18c000200 [Shinella sp. DD12]MDG4673661.1 DUF982 domain-containing protein [Shinella sp. 838]
MLAEIYFATPISVTFTNGTSRLFQGVHDALDFLENEWPLRSGDRYKRACERCRAALQFRTPATVAREAFVSACLEAGMPVQALSPLWHRSGPSTPPLMNA